MMLALFLLVCILLMALGLPVAMALGGAAAAYILADGGLSFTLLAQTTFAGMASFPLLAIPLFMLAGNLMNAGGITADMVRFARLATGHLSGGLGLATILASAGFAAISGSAVATAIAVGAVMIPAMRDAGYDDEVSASVTATASCMGPIIPPSIPFILYGVIANVSISSLFLAGVLPGLLLGAALMAYMVVVARRRGYPREKRASLRELAVGAFRALPALLLPVVILGGIFGGVFTPTEAAGIAVIYALLVGVLFYRRLALPQLPPILLNAGIETGLVMLLLGLSEPFAWVVALEQAPARLVEAMAQVSSAPWIFLLLLNLALLVIGIPLETAPAITIVTPVVAPMAAQLGLDPVHLGVVVCFNLVLGLITPPVGAVLFSICGISGLPLERLSKGIWVPFLISVGVLFVVTFVPVLSTWLPATLLGGK